MTHPTFFSAIASGNVDAVRAHLAEAADPAAILATRDADGLTPLMHAVRLCDGGSMTGTLVDAGADVHAVGQGDMLPARSLLALALNAGDPGAVSRLLAAGADLQYEREGYGAMLDAVHGRELRDDMRLLPLLSLLIERGVPLDRITCWQESALRVLSRTGRFDAVALLLSAGADAKQLGWSALHRAVAFNSVRDVAARIDAGDDIEARDFWSRTPWHVAILRGDLDIMRLLQKRGADVDAVARCGEHSLSIAVSARGTAVLEFLLANGAAVDRPNDFGYTALMDAAERGRIDAVQILVAAGAQLEVALTHPSEAVGYPPGLAEALRQAADKGVLSGALEHTSDAKVARLLLDAGADPQLLQYEARRALLGLPGERALQHLEIDPAMFHRGRKPRFGAANPERINEPFWHAMIRAGCCAYTARRRFGDHADICGPADPVWCARRFGQSISFLDDGRIVQIGGEHEDSYDPDFCIYNDVFVHDPDGTITILGYRKAVFPPTDFHTATIVGQRIIIIGGLGYCGERHYGSTPVYALHLRRFRIERLACTGDAPGWLYKHRAVLVDPHTVVVSGGTVLECPSQKEVFTPMEGRYRLDLQRLEWSREDVWPALAESMAHRTATPLA